MSIDLNSRGRQKAIGQSKNNPSGYDAYGVKVPSRRLTAALECFRKLAPESSTETQILLIGKAAHYIEEDKPYEAQRVLFQDAPNWGNSNIEPGYLARDKNEKFVAFPESPLDLCGALMVLSYLLTG